jgi:hypothetical protein
MSLHDLAKSDRAAIVDPDIGLGEPILYRPKSGASRTINAVVDRFTPQQVAGTPVAAPKLIIHARNHATLGVTSVDQGGDAFDVAEQFGGTATRRMVAKAILYDGGWTITLR